MSKVVQTSSGHIFLISGPNDVIFSAIESPDQGLSKSGLKSPRRRSRPKLHPSEASPKVPNNHHAPHLSAANQARRCDWVAPLGRAVAPVPPAAPVSVLFPPQTHPNPDLPCTPPRRTHAATLPPPVAPKYAP